jgi:hypothetical protein
MPHFSSWSWPVEYLGPLDEALDKIERIEKGAPWEKKIKKAVWRGTTWFSPDWNPGLRPNLVEVAGGKEWADVELWGQGQEQNNTIPIEEFCRYRYIVYTEVCLRNPPFPCIASCCCTVTLSSPRTASTQLTENTHRA